MTIQFNQAVQNIGGVNYSASQTATLDPQTEYRLVGLNLAAWVGLPPPIADAATGVYVADSGSKSGGNRFVLMGDSITAQNFQNSVPTAMSRSGNVVTVTSASHALLTDQRIRVNAAVPDDFNGPATITKIDANSYRYTSVGADGAATLNSDFQVLRLEHGSSQGYWCWLNSLFGGGLYMAGITAVGGQTTTSILDQVAEAQSYLPTHAIVLAGINDVVAGTATATIIANLETIYLSMISVGATVVALSVTPLGSAHASDSLANSVKILEINRWIRAFCANTQGMIYVDAYSAVVDPLSATAGDYKTDYSVDGIHPQPVGGKAIAAAIYAKLSPFLTVPSPLVVSNADNYGTDSGSKSVWDSAPWVNTSGGSVSGSVTGDVMAGVTVTEGGSGAIVCTIDARTDGRGYDQTMVFTPGAAADLAAIEGTITSARVTAGDTLQIAVEVTISGAAGANLMGLYAYIKEVIGGASGFAYSQSNSTNEARSGVVDGTYTLVSPPLTIGAGFTALSWQVRATSAGAGTAATIKVGRISVIKSMWDV